MFTGILKALTSKWPLMHVASYQVHEGTHTHAVHVFAHREAIERVYS